MMEDLELVFPHETITSEKSHVIDNNVVVAIVIIGPHYFDL